MCEDGKSETMAEAGATSSRVHPPSTSGRSGRSSRLPTPESLPQDSDGRRLARSFLADSLIDMRLPSRASRSPRPRNKRGIDQVTSGSLPPSPDKMFLELDEQHEEARRARPAPIPITHEDEKPEEVEGQYTKRQRRLPIHGSNPMREAAPTSAAEMADGSNGKTSKRPSESPSSPKRQEG